MIELAEKKKFINWLIQSVSLKSREAYWILNYLLNHEFLLNKVVFVEDALFTPRGLVITDQTISGSGIEMVKQGIKIEDANQIFHEIRLNRKETLFFEVKFEGMYQSKYFLSVLEENEYQPMDETLKETIDNELNTYFKNEDVKYQLDTLLKEINQALEKEDKALFLSLSEKYQELKKCK